MSAWCSNNRRRLAGIVALGVAAIFSGCGPDWWISEYPDGVSFHGRKGTRGGYDHVVWVLGQFELISAKSSKPTISSIDHL